MFSPAEAAEHLAGLLQETPWETRVFRIYGRDIPMPRQICMYGPWGYRYSGVDHPPRALTPRLEAIRQRCEARTGAPYNSVLVNHYRSGADSVSWHSDDDYGHGPHPTIASLSLGATRRFSLRSRGPGPTERHHIDLADGSLLCMRGHSQRDWQHQVAKTRRAVGPRINLTFRWMEDPG